MEQPQPIVAKIVCDYIHRWCEAKWPVVEGSEEPPHLVGKRMASTVANGHMMDVFDHKGHGSHKYIPADKLTADLGLPEGAGVYGYWQMYDGSYVLLTCQGPLAWWDGRADSKAEWVP